MNVSMAVVATSTRGTLMGRRGAAVCSSGAAESMSQFGLDAGIYARTSRKRCPALLRHCSCKVRMSGLCKIEMSSFMELGWDGFFRVSGGRGQSSYHQAKIRKGLAGVPPGRNYCGVERNSTLQASQGQMVRR